MRHGMAHRKFHRTKNQRKALLSGLAINLIEHERITTTLPKAKEIRPVVERMITQGKKNAQRNAYPLLMKKLRFETAAHKVISVLAPRMEDRCGGYLRIIKAGFRYGDNAPMAIIEFVDRDVSALDKKVAKKASTKKTAAS